MTKLFRLIDRFVQSSDWKTISLLKTCTCMVGVLLGLTVAEKHKKPVAAAALMVFLMTYIPLMSKLFTLLIEDGKTSSRDFTI